MYAHLPEGILSDPAFPEVISPERSCRCSGGPGCGWV